MYKVLTLNNISVKGLDRLPRDAYEVTSETATPDAIMLRSYNMHEMAVPGSLVAVGRAGAGVNNIPVDKLSTMGVAVFNAPGANANAVKELVVAGMLLAYRNICQAWDYARRLEGDPGEVKKAVEAGKKKYVGYELPGRTLGVIGLGAIGVQVANAARALGMKVVGFDPGITVQSAWKLAADVEQAVSIDDLLGRVDFVTFHVPYLEATRNLLSAERIALMREGAVVLNFARDGIVDDTAVLEALDAGRLYAYVTDFPNIALTHHPRVIALPHLGASTAEAEENCAIMVADQLRDYLEHGNLRNSVNFPNVNLPRASEHRIAVVNENRPDMVGQISHAFGKSDVNIIHMINESRGAVAYTLIDVDRDIDQGLETEIAGIGGVLKVRVL
jgi:D-3-phosphoglycerate dehydrogenase